MKEAVLVIIKPDGMKEGVVGNVFSKLSRAKLEMIAVKILKPTKKLSEEHYCGIKGMPFFNQTISYFMGKTSKQKQLLSVIYYGDNAIKKMRKMAGDTNPEDAEANSIRGSYGRVTTKGVFENVIHVSSAKKDAKREIQLWYKPEEIMMSLYPTQKKRMEGRVWK